MADALSHGVTSVQDFSDWQDFLVYEEMEKEGKLHLRISEWLPFKLPLTGTDRRCGRIMTRTTRCCTQEC